MFFFAVRNHSDSIVNEPFAVLLCNSQSFDEFFELYCRFLSQAVLLHKVSYTVMLQKCREV